MNISIDYAVAERTERAAVVPADLGWSDVGSWGALWELGTKDESGNVALGDVVLEAAEKKSRSEAKRVQAIDSGLSVPDVLRSGE